MEKIKFAVSDTEIVEFTVEDQTSLNGINYLLVSEETEGEYNAYILKEVNSEGEDTIYEMVEDDTEFEAIARIFEEQMDDDTELAY